jgi:non-homologous end joining protein Ku
VKNLQLLNNNVNNFDPGSFSDIFENNINNLIESRKTLDKRGKKIKSSF